MTQGDAFTLPEGRIGWIQRTGLLKSGQSLLMPAKVAKGGALAMPCLSEIGAQRDGPLTGGQCRIMLPEFTQYDACVLSRSGVVGTQVEGLLKRGKGLRVPPQHS